MSEPTTYSPKAQGFQPVALVLALLFPGAGHLYLKETKRGVLAAAGVMGLFVGGVFIGGIDVVDSKEDRIWFLGQALVGPTAFGVDYLHQNHFKVRTQAQVYGPGGVPRVIETVRSPNPDEGRGADGRPVAGGTPPYEKSVGKTNELGTLFATIAGMMNFIVALDAAWPGRPKPGETPGAGGTRAAGRREESHAGVPGVTP